MATYHDGLTPKGEGEALERLRYWLAMDPRALFHALGMAKVDNQCRADRLTGNPGACAGDMELGRGAAIAAHCIDVLRELVPAW